MAVALSLTSGAVMVAFSLSVFNVSSRVMFFMFCSDMICEERKDKETKIIWPEHTKRLPLLCRNSFTLKWFLFLTPFLKSITNQKNSFLFLFSWHFLFLFRQIPLFSISASKSFNNVCIVIAMIIVYKLFSQLHLITNLEVFRLRTIYLRTHFMWRKFFWLIEIKKNDIQVFFSEKSTGLSSSAKVLLIDPAADVYMIIWFNQSANEF